MKKLLNKIVYAILVFFLIITFTVIFERPIIADVGSFESYDSGGSDWSSSSWDYDDDYSYSSGGTTFVGGGFGTVVFIIICVIIGIAKSRGNNGNIKRPSINYQPIVDETTVENQVKTIDEMFNKDEFIAWTKDLFVKLQEAWTARDWSTIRHFESNELFEQHQKQLQGYIDNHQINIMERICVKSAVLSEFRQSADKDVLTVILSSKMVDYIINDETKAIIKGDTTTDRHSTYKLVFVRKTGVKTKPGMNTVDTKNCPNCGAPTEITSSGKCDYCGSVITTGEFNWVLSNLEKLY